MRTVDAVLAFSMKKYGGSGDDEAHGFWDSERLLAAPGELFTISVPWAADMFRTRDTEENAPRA